MSEIKFTYDASYTTIISASDHDSAEIPNGITTIGKNAFHSCCLRLTSITIPDSVTHIENYAFLNTKILYSNILNLTNLILLGLSGLLIALLINFKYSKFSFCFFIISVLCV